MTAQASPAQWRHSDDGSPMLPTCPLALQVGNTPEVAAIRAQGCPKLPQGATMEVYYQVHIPPPRPPVTPDNSAPVTVDELRTVVRQALRDEPGTRDRILGRLETDLLWNWPTSGAVPCRKNRLTGQLTADGSHVLPQYSTGSRLGRTIMRATQTCFATASHSCPPDHYRHCPDCQDDSREAQRIKGLIAAHLNGEDSPSSDADSSTASPDASGYRRQCALPGCDKTFTLDPRAPGRMFCCDNHRKADHKARQRARRGDGVPQRRRRKAP